ncbi:glycosyltransferase [Rhodococcus sp. IEGM 1374]|uniref:glycosyltransferase n=1 Tax=Rhodococcus sp. IEGM 1374 TaxID=3082221 RepID=UPI002952D24A|nr:glycosyltransferase [Rhodococcus sp. IEGM 1374]MDV7991228.1 glycosyltransferase [Rhodococcus sp. IEGM 1374]
MFHIATPNYNYGRYLADAIESVRMQGIPGSVHCIQDGVSTDDSEKVAAKHIWQGLSFKSEKDLGQSDAVNRAFAQVQRKAQYIAWLNSDEYYLPFAFQEVTAYFLRNPGVDIVFGDSIHVDGEGKYLRLLAQHGFSRRILRTYGTFIQTSSTFYRRNVYDSGDLKLKPEFKQVMDLELFVRLDRLGYKFGHISRPLSAFRVHPEQQTAIHGSQYATDERSRIPSVINGALGRTVGRTGHQILKVSSGAILRELAYNRRYKANVDPISQDSEAANA